MKAKILLVEDEDVLRDCLSKYLHLEGFEVLTFSSGEQAISLTLRDRPDVILMDLGLPGMSGIEAAQVIKKNPQISNIPIIALSGRPPQDWEEIALKAGVDMYLTKPGSLTDIVKTTHQFLGTLAMK